MLNKVLSSATTLIVILFLTYNITIEWIKIELFSKCFKIQDQQTTIFICTVALKKLKCEALLLSNEGFNQAQVKYDLDEILGVELCQCLLSKNKTLRRYGRFPQLRTYYSPDVRNANKKEIVEKIAYKLERGLLFCISKRLLEQNSKLLFSTTF